MKRPHHSDLIRLKMIQGNNQEMQYSAPLSGMKQQLVSQKALWSPPFPTHKVIIVKIAKTDSFSPWHINHTQFREAQTTSQTLISDWELHKRLERDPSIQTFPLCLPNSCDLGSDVTEQNICSGRSSETIPICKVLLTVKSSIAVVMALLKGDRT